MAKPLSRGIRSYDEERENLARLKAKTTEPMLLNELSELERQLDKRELKFIHDRTGESIVASENTHAGKITELELLIKEFASDCYRGKFRKSGPIISHLSATKANYSYILARDNRLNYETMTSPPMYFQLPFGFVFDENYPNFEFLPPSRKALNNLMFNHSLNYLADIALWFAVYKIDEEYLHFFSHLGNNIYSWSTDLINRMVSVFANNIIEVPPGTYDIPVYLSAIAASIPILAILKDIFLIGAEGLATFCTYVLNDISIAEHRIRTTDSVADIIPGAGKKIFGKSWDSYLPTLSSMLHKRFRGKEIINRLPFVAYDSITQEDIGRYHSYLHDIIEDAQAGEISFDPNDLEAKLDSIFETKVSGLSAHDRYGSAGVSKLKKIMVYIINRTTRQKISDRTRQLIMRTYELTNNNRNAISDLNSSFTNSMVENFNSRAERFAPVYNRDTEILNNISDLLRLIKEAKMNDEDKADRVHSDNMYSITTTYLGYLGSRENKIKAASLGDEEITSEDIAILWELLNLGNMPETSKIEEVMGLEKNSGLRESYPIYLKHAIIKRSKSPVSFLDDKESMLIDDTCWGVKFSDTSDNGQTLGFLGPEKSLKNLGKYFAQRINLKGQNSANYSPFVLLAGRPAPKIFDNAKVHQLVSYAITGSVAGLDWIRKVNEMYAALPESLRVGLERKGLQPIPANFRVGKYSNPGWFKKSLYYLFNETSRHPEKSKHLYNSIYRNSFEAIKPLYGFQNSA